MRNPGGCGPARPKGPPCGFAVYRVEFHYVKGAKETGALRWLLRDAAQVIHQFGWQVSWWRRPPLQGSFERSARLLRCRGALENGVLLLRLLALVRYLVYGGFEDP